MRRFKKPSNGGLFYRAEWLRIVSLIMALVVLYMLIQRSRDASVWRWLANDSGAEVASSNGVAPASAKIPEDSGLFDGPTDLDPDEVDAIHELFGAVSDKSKLSAEEMPAYWRLWRWARAQSLVSLRQRARSDVSLAHFLETPDKWRGQLVRLRLHLRRSLSWEIGPEEKSGGAKRVYEAWGWSDESPNFYCIVFTQPPPDMPIGPNVQDEVTFCGYFLKVMSYRDQQDKLRVAPMLIGRVERHEVPSMRTNEEPWSWAMLGVGGLVLLILLVRWTRAYGFPRSEVKSVDQKTAHASIAKFLDMPADSDNMNSAMTEMIPPIRHNDLPDKRDTTDQNWH